MAVAIGIAPARQSYLCRVLRLTLLAPEIVEAIMDARQPAELTSRGLIKEFLMERQRGWQAS